MQIKQKNVLLDLKDVLGVKKVTINMTHETLLFLEIRYRSGFLFPISYDCEEELNSDYNRITKKLNECKCIKKNNSKWISVKERLPDDLETVLWRHDLKIRDKNPNVFNSIKYMAGYYMKDINSVRLDDFNEYGSFFPIEEFTHWMPLPEDMNNDE